MLTDSLWFYAGRRFGRRVLGMLCRISISPDTCVRQSELSFARRGVATLVVAKFIPGMSLLASPMAGAIGMPLPTFALFNLAGTVLWAGSGISFGLLFHDQARQLLQLLSDLGRAAALVVAICLVLYIAHRLWRRYRAALLMAKVPRLAATELSDLIARGAELVILDVRAKLAPSTESEQLPGARHIELSEIDLIAFDTWSPNARIVTYCACPNDASALKAAHLLIKRGRVASALRGGIEGWSQAGYALEAAQPGQ